MGNAQCACKAEESGNGTETLVDVKEYDATGEFNGVLAATTGGFDSPQQSTLTRKPTYSTKGLSANSAALKRFEMKKESGSKDPVNFHLTSYIAAKIERQIAEACRLVQKEYRAELEERMYAVAGLAWNDRTHEIQALRTECREKNEALAKVVKNLDRVAQDSERLVVVSTGIPEVDEFRAAIKKPEWILLYDHEKTTATELAKLIDEKAKKLNPLTLALATHGANDSGRWSITKNCTVDMRAAKPELAGDTMALFKSLAKAAQSRVDLLACDLASTPGGLAMIKELEDTTKMTFAASTNHTGNLKRGGDWVMETEHVDTAGIYFNEEVLYNWNGLLLAHSHAAVHASVQHEHKWSAEAQKAQHKIDRDHIQKDLSSKDLSTRMKARNKLRERKDEDNYESDSD
eukprot:gnl/TRDRNA2_/TRDRNA2_136526_c0_seq2.p1 gnl/TRDRNA2_/TRDRNA2_136526_c0~~gnl/TRDRNA2_/TRDRNA2_136526_c0_seq2.p1  ORF type:complete len:404 (+),score=85.98 gnl/TRDRNA2_/TRDRNA2_136526_c0_seq2:62-1273(+)